MTDSTTAAAELERARLVRRLRALLASDAALMAWCEHVCDAIDATGQAGGRAVLEEMCRSLCLPDA